jgi:hypothetical protein
MVVVMPTTAIVLALAKGWFHNRNKSDSPHTKKEAIMDTDNNSINSESNNCNSNLTLKTAIGTVLKVAYDTTIGVGVGKLLATPGFSER